jgi:putative SOS response-associated peptidase YedK
MCGRFTLRTPARDIARMFDVAVPDIDPRYNIAPSQDVATVRFDAAKQQREFALLRWGLVPFWADDPKIGYKMINARSETVAEKPAFRKAFAQRRCLIPADGFYEWKQTDDGKQPFLIHRQDHTLFAFAGLWEHWSRGGQQIESCTILVTEPNELVASIHNRMPVILAPADYDAWLDPGCDDRQKLQSLLRPCAAAELEVYPVSRVVNKPVNDVPQCVQPIEDET